MYVIIKSVSLLTSTVQDDPGIIVGPISQFLGIILNAIFSFVTLISENHSLGFSIIIFTLIVRALMIPFSVKSQKSMSKMQQLQPEIEKIKARYGDSKDPELQKKMNAEVQALYSKSGVNPLGGCLPLIVQFPIFIALNYCMQQSFRFITRLNEIYRGMVEWICGVDGWADMIKELALSKLRSNQNNFMIGNEDEAMTVNFMKVINKFVPSDWDSFFSNFENAPDLNTFTELFTQKINIENFFGINMLELPGWAFPAILIPILSGVFSFLTSWQSSKLSTSNDNNSKMTQKVMMFAMPLMMLYFTFTMPAGVGLYWTVSSIFQIFQQMLLTKHYKPQPVITEKKVITVKSDKKKKK